MSFDVEAFIYPPEGKHFLWSYRVPVAQNARDAEAQAFEKALRMYPYPGFRIVVGPAIQVGKKPGEDIDEGSPA